MYEINVSNIIHIFHIGYEECVLFYIPFVHSLQKHTNKEINSIPLLKNLTKRRSNIHEKRR